VRVAPEAWTAEAVRAALAAAGAEEPEVEETEATLEDVFLAVAGRGGAAEAA
jgi:hypothetical protein